MKRRDFLMGSASLLALTPVRPALAQAWQNNFNVTRNASGPVLTKEMFGANILSPFDDISGNNSNHGFTPQAKNNLGARFTSYGGRGIMRWPGGGLTEGEKTSGNWVQNTGVDFGDLDPGSLSVTARGQWQGYLDGATLKRRWLRTTLDDFLSYLDSNPSIQGVIVLPTFRYLRPWGYSGNRVYYNKILGSGSATLQTFVQYVYDRIASHYPEARIFAWEVGNEYEAGGANGAMTPQEYARLAETAARAIRVVDANAKVAIQAGPLTSNITDYEPAAAALYSQFQARAGNFGTDDPDFLVHHIYESWDDGHIRQQNVLEYIQTLWGGIPVLASEWNITDPSDHSLYNDTLQRFRLGMERAYRLTAMFDTMISANVQAAAFWPIVHDHVGTSMFRYESPIKPYIAATIAEWLSSTLQGVGSSTMRRADVVYAPVSTTGTAIEVFAYCRDDRRRATVFVCARNAVAQDVKIRIYGMRPNSVTCFADRMYGASGPMPYVDTALPTASVNSGIPVTITSVSGGRQFEFALRDSSTNTEYDVVRLTVTYS